MRGFKDLIARRRPVTDGGHEDKETDAQDPWDELQQTATQPVRPPRFSEADSARAARDHVPRPPRPKPLMSRKWTPQDAHLARQAENRQAEAPDPEAAAAALALRDPEVQRRPPQTRMILSDLEMIQSELPDDAAAPDPAARPRSVQAPSAPQSVQAPSAPRAAVPSRPKIWDIEPADPKAPAPGPAASAEGSALAQSAASAYGPGAQPAARPASTRAKTRLLGFHSEAAAPDVLDTAPAVAASEAPRFPIGWLVVTDGPGRGASFTLTAGLSTVGRDADQTVTLDFGDSAISRERHVAIAYDEDENRTYVGHGGKANIVKLNDKPLLTTEALNDGDIIRIGKTQLRFVAFCTEGFCWSRDAGETND